MIESAAADRDDGEEISVDMSADDPSKAVTRRRGSVKPAKAGKGGESDEWLERSRKVQKRISNMQRAFDQRDAEREARHQREIAGLRADLDKLKVGDRSGPAGDDAAHEKEMADLQAKYEEAGEVGDAKEQARLARLMAQKEGQYWAAKTAKQTQGGSDNATRTQDGAGGGTSRQAPVTANGAPGTGRYAPTKAGIAWAKANEDWWFDQTDDTHQEARALANRIFMSKIDNGDDSNDPEFYEEIAQRVKKRFPELEIQERVGGGKRRASARDDDPDGEGGDDPTMREANGNDQDQDRRGRMPVTTLDRGQPVRRNNRNSQSITKSDQAAMRAVGLDPTNNKHVVQWVREGNAMAEAE